MDIFIKILIGAAGIWIGYKLAVARKVSFYTKASEDRKENMKKLLNVIKKHKDRITNDDVERILGVSDSTAERYLNELEKEGVIKQVGAGRGVYYERK